MKKVLLVDDEKDIVEVIASRLKANNYNVIIAYDGQEALDKTHKEKPDLIILDLMLPKMDGYKVCGLLKTDTRYNKIPIIIFTARAQESDMKMGQEVSADDYITKPFDPEELLFKIKKFIG